MDNLIVWLNQICIWIYRLAYLNILWFLFTFLGLGILGFYPATAATFVIVRKWIIDEEPPLLKTFWSTYKQEFLKINLLGYILLFFGLFLFADLKFFQSSENTILFSLSYIYIPLIILYLVTVLYIFPVYTQYDLKIIHVIKNAFLLSIGNFLPTLLMIGGILFVWYIVYSIPILMIFFSFSPVAFILMWCANLAFSKYQKMRQQLANEK